MGLVQVFLVIITRYIEFIRNVHHLFHLTMLGIDIIYVKMYIFGCFEHTRDPVKLLHEV